MFKKYKLQTTIILLLVIFTLACASLQVGIVTPTSDEVSVSMDDTQGATLTPTIETQKTPATPTLFPPTITPTTIPPTEVPPTKVLPTSTPKTYCDWASFVKDVSIPDGTVIQAGKTFVKTWRLKNRGSCTWTADYALTYSSGNQMGQTSTVKFPGNVAPGETVDLSVTLTAPASSGNYRGYWMLRNSSGAIFGFGDNANKAFYVDIRSSSLSSGTVSGAICFPSEKIPPMTLYLQNMSKNKLFQFSIQENQSYYQFEVEPGEYMAYAWTLNFEIAGGYTMPDHRLQTFNVSAGYSASGIDICDWYGDPGTIPLPKEENYGSITGKLSFPSEQIPPLRIVATDIYNDAHHWVDTVTNQQTYEIKGLMPGYYMIVAYPKTDSSFAGGYSEYAKCGLLSTCPDDHTLVIVYVTPGMTSKDINPSDWYAPAGTFPSDPTP